MLINDCHLLNFSFPACRRIGNLHTKITNHVWVIEEHKYILKSNTNIQPILFSWPESTTTKNQLRVLLIRCTKIDKPYIQQLLSRILLDFIKYLLKNTSALLIDIVCLILKIETTIRLDPSFHEVWFSIFYPHIFRVKFYRWHDTNNDYKSQL